MATRRRRPGAPSRAVCVTAGVASLALVLAACGTRVSDERVVQASGGAPAATSAAPQAAGGAQPVAPVVPSDGSNSGVPAAPGGKPAPAVSNPQADGFEAAPSVEAQGSTSGSDTRQPGSKQPARGQVGGGPSGAGQSGGGQSGAGKPGSGKSGSGKSGSGKSGSGKSGGGKSGSGESGSGKSGSGTPSGDQSASAGATLAGDQCTEAGPPIILGQVVEASGIIGANVASAIPVLGAWEKYINAQGGIACHPVQVIAQDSASDPAQASSAVQDLVKNRKAIGLVANFVPLSISGFKSAVDQLKAPVVGGDLFSTVWWEDPLFYPVGTHVDANAFGSTEAVAKRGADKVAVIYCIEAAVCPPYKDAIVRNQKAGAYEVVYDAQVSITAPDYTVQCQAAKDAGATQISMILEGSGVSRLARSCAGIGYFPKFAVASLGATFDPEDKNVQKLTVTIASAAADWFSNDDAKGQKAFQEAMKTYVPSLDLDPTAPLAWADAMMVKAAIEKLGEKAFGRPITTAMLREGLSMIKKETLDGMIKATSFSPTMGPNPKTECYFSDVFGPPGRWETGSSGCLETLSDGSRNQASSQTLDAAGTSPAVAASRPSRTAAVARRRRRLVGGVGVAGV